MKIFRIICVAVAVLGAVALGVVFFTVGTEPLWPLYVSAMVALGGLLGNAVGSVIQLIIEEKKNKENQ